MVATWKKEKVENLADKMAKSKVVGAVSIKGIPSKQLQKIRKSLKKDLELQITRKSLILRSIEKAGMKELEPYINGEIGLIFTDMNPFKLSKSLKACRVNAPAKPGTIAPMDIIVPAGETPLPPGPIIADLQKVRIKAQIKGPKIVVTEDSLVAKEGEPISADLAPVLSRLDIKPIEIGLEILAAVEDKTVFAKDVLDIDETKVVADVQSAYRNAFNLAMNSGIFNSATIKIMLQNAHIDARNLAINAEIVTKETVKILISKAGAKAVALNSIIPEMPAEPVAEEAAKEEPKKAEEPAIEEKPAEQKPKEEAEAPNEEAPAEEKAEETPEKAAEEAKSTEEPKAEEAPGEEEKKPESDEQKA